SGRGRHRRRGRDRLRRLRTAARFPPRTTGHQERRKHQKEKCLLHASTVTEHDAISLTGTGRMRRAMTERKRVGIFGWGVVAPKSPNIQAFERNLEQADSWLTPFRGYGQSNFLVGDPEFDFETYHEWFDQRFPPAKFSQLADKMGPMAKFAIGAFIQSLQQNPGVETYLQSLKTRCHIYVGTGLGDITITEREALNHER